MRMACVLLLCLSVFGCGTINAIKESGGNHPVAYLGVQAATQAATYEWAKRVDDLAKVEVIRQAIGKIQSQDDPTVLDWERGRVMIATQIKPPYTAGALLIYGILETELSPLVDEGGVTVEMVNKYVNAAYIGVSSGLAQVYAERQRK